MDPQPIVLEESNVESVIHDIEIEEERVRDDASIVLTQEQIVNELTNIFISHYKRLGKVNKKVNMFMSLFQSQQNDVSNNIKRLDTFQPIALCRKVILINDGDKKDIYGNLGQDVQDMYFMKTKKFKSYLSDLQSHTKSKSTPYTNTMNSLYSIKPFIGVPAEDRPSGFHMEKLQPQRPLEFYRHFVFEEYSDEDLEKGHIDKYEMFRTIPNIQIDTSKRPDPPDEKPGCTAGLHYNTNPNIINLHSGDTIDVIGFLNRPSFSHTSFESFDINQYLRHLAKLTVGEQVQVLFNDYVFDTNRRIIQDIPATVVKKDDATISIKFQKSLLMNRQVPTDTLLIHLSKPSICFVYGKGYKGFKYAKNFLKSKAIAFNLHKKGIETTLQFLHPSCPSEMVYVNHDMYTDWINFRHSFASLGIDYDSLPSSMYNVLQHFTKSGKLRRPERMQSPRFTFSTESMPKFLQFIKSIGPKYYKKLYTDLQSFSDSRLNRYAYLKRKNDYGMLYLLTVIKKALAAKSDTFAALPNPHSLIEKLQAKLDSVRKQITDVQPKKTFKLAIAKIYHSLSELEQDNDAKAYFDKNLDSTRYDIKNKVSANLTGDELKYAIIDILVNDSKSKGLSKGDLETEAKWIMKGRRLVKDGDQAVLQLADSTSILYERRDISGKHLWVKVFQAPYNICSKPLEDITDIENPEIFTLDPFDSICKKAKNQQLYVTQNTLLQKIKALEAIAAFIQDVEELKKSIQHDIHAYHNLWKLYDDEDSLQNVRRPVRIDILGNSKDLHSHDDNAYAEYIGDMDFLDLDKVYNNIEYGDAIDRDVNTVRASPGQVANLDENTDIIQTLIDVLDIDISKDKEEFILKYVNSLHRNTIPEQLVEEENKIRQSQKHIYEKAKNNPLHLAKFNKLVKDKLAQVEERLLKTHYQNVIVSMAALVNILMIIDYPNIKVNRHVPKCVKSFSYIGYPVVDSTSTPSFTRYICCVIASLANPGDVKFDQFSHMNLAQIESLVHTEVDKILETQAQLSSLVETKKQFIKQYTRKDMRGLGEFSKYMTLNLSFKPNFKYPEHTNSVLAFLSHINNTIKASEIHKRNIYNRPLIGNLCCMEKVTDSTNYYDFFRDNEHQRLSLKKKNKITSPSYKPTIRLQTSEDMFSKQTVRLSKAKVVSNDSDVNDQPNALDKFVTLNPIFTKPELDITDEEAWENQSSVIYDAIVKTIKSFENVSSVDEDVTVVLKSKIITMRYLLNASNQGISLIEQLKNFRESVFNFLKFQLTTILSRIVHKKMTATDEEWNSLIDSVSENSSYDVVLERIKKLIPNYIDILGQNDTVDTEQSTTILSRTVYVILKILYSILYMTVKEDANPKITTFTNLSSGDKKRLTISSNIVRHILNKLHVYTSTNNVYSDVKKRVEELREEKKQAKMSRYSADDETRRLQITLEKMGLEVNDPNAPPKEVNLDVDILQNDNKMQEQEQYRIGDYQGENPDDNEDPAE
jgi:hypothetical protein